MSLLTKAMVVISALAGAQPASTNQLIGEWGGDRVALSITAQGAQMRLDCGAGHFPVPTAIDRHGKFNAPGTLEFYRPGPSRVDDRPVAPKAVYHGHLDNNRLILTVDAVGPASSHQYILTRDRHVKLVRCL